MSSLPKTVTRQRRDYELNPDPSAPESSTLTTRLLSHPVQLIVLVIRRWTVYSVQRSDSDTGGSMVQRAASQFVVKSSYGVTIIDW